MKHKKPHEKNQESSSGKVSMSCFIAPLSCMKILIQMKDVLFLLSKAKWIYFFETATFL